MSKETFTDDSYSLCKALFNISSAKQYLELINLDNGKATKMLFNSFIQKLSYILSNILDRVNETDRNILKKELADSVSLDAILDDLVRMNPEQRSVIEKLTNAMVKGDSVTFSKD